MKKFLPVILAVLCASAVGACAQMEMPGSPAGVNAGLLNLFGDVKAFSAKSEVRVLDKNQQEKVSTPMDFALLDGKMRVEVDMGLMKDRDMPPAAAASMKQMGMDRVVSIFRPDKQANYIIFPAMQAYVNMALSKEEVEAYKKNTKLEKTSLGKETIEGHPCTKHKVVMTDGQGQKHEALVWNASDLKDFPVQIQTKERDDTVILRYRQVRLTRPDAKQFETPASYKAYDDMQSLMQGAMMKAMSRVGHQGSNTKQVAMDGLQQVRNERARQMDFVDGFSVNGTKQVEAR